MAFNAKDPSPASSVSVFGRRKAQIGSYHAAS